MAKTVYRVENPKGHTDTFTSKAKAFTRAASRARRECGEVAIYEAQQSSPGIFRYVKTSPIWRSDWRSCPSLRGLRGRSKRKRKGR
jgi:hypothetical protein